MPKKKTQKTKRSETKYPGLVKEVNLKIRQAEIDQDYIKKLSHKEKEWLSNFMEEYVAANFNHPGKKLHKGKKRQRDCYNRNNSRNRDVYGLSKINDLLTDESSFKTLDKKAVVVEENEDFLITMIDLKKAGLL